MRYFLSLVLLSMLLASCGDSNNSIDELESKMNKTAEAYVKLILQIGLFDPAYVDAYYGPEEWLPEDDYDETKKDSVLNSIDSKINILLDDLDNLVGYSATDLLTLRYRYLYKQLLAAKAKVFMLRGGEFSFDAEAKNLYDADPPEYDSLYFQNILGKIDSILPGEGNLYNRLIAFREKFIIPENKLDTVFRTAIAECRKLTRQHIQLPKEENFEVEYVKNKPWGAYNWYKGNGFSLIQVNTDLPIYIDRAIDLAAHEGYPGHHVYNLLLENKLVKEKGWVEYSVYPLYSPQSLIAEGTANFGIQMIFPEDSRLEYEKNILFPLAGLDPSFADEYYAITGLLDRLSYSVNEAARNYLNGRWNREQTVQWLKKYALESDERAEKTMSFIETYRSYVINYNLGKDLVKEYIGRKSMNRIEDRWKNFEFLISTPQTPSGLIFHEEN